MLFPLGGRRIFVAGHRGMVGSALIRRLAQEECQILTVGRDTVDLRDQRAVGRWFDEPRPEAVLLAAARVGGIHENDTHPGDFLYDKIPEVSARSRGTRAAAGTAECDLVETRIELNRGPPHGLWGIEARRSPRGGHSGERQGLAMGVDPGEPRPDGVARAGGNRARAAEWCAGDARGAEARRRCRCRDRAHQRGDHRQARGGHELSCQADALAGRDRGMAPIGSIRPPQQGQRSCA